VGLGVINEMNGGDTSFVGREGDHGLGGGRPALDVDAAQLVAKHQQRRVSRQHRKRRSRCVAYLGHHL